MESDEELLELLQELRDTPFAERKRWFAALKPAERELLDRFMSLLTEAFPGYLEFFWAFGREALEGVAAGTAPVPQAGEGRLT